MMRARWVVLGVAAAGSAVALGCSEPAQPASVVLTAHTVPFTAIGATKQLGASVLDKAGKGLTGTSLSWASSDAAVATVDQTGLVTAVGVGAATVRVSAGALGDSATVTVTQVPTHVDVASGGGQSAAVGQALPQPLVVRVSDSLDTPIANAAVAFTVSTDGGAVSPPSGTTGADGQVSTTWTLGTKSGAFQVSAAVPGASQPAVFTATASPAPANNLARAAGDGQFGFKGTTLAVLIAVRVRDQYGNGVPRAAVQFSAAAGSVDSTIAFTDSTGVARTGWKMPATLSGIADTIALQASASAGGNPLLGSPIAFTAVAHGISVSAPDTLREGQSVALNGTGFDTGNTENVVTIDGDTAAVTGASATQLTVTVPAFDCMPARTVPLQVTVYGIPAAPASAPLVPAQAALNLAVGQQAIVADPASFCLQFAPSSASEAYLVGVQSTSETVTDLQAITLVGTAAGAAAAAPRPAPAFRTQRAGASAITPASGRLARWLRWGQAEVRRRQLDRPLFERALTTRLTAPLAARGARLVSDTLQQGDTVAVNFPADSCGPGDTVRAQVRVMGQHGIWLEDLSNPAKYDSATITQISQVYDGKIYPADTLEFGTPADADGNGRFVIVITREVNRMGGGELGFVTSCDLLAPAATNASNGGEFTYILAPDPTGTLGFTYSTADGARDLPDVTAHESVHIIQFTRRYAASHPFPDIWWAEGQAVLGEEVVGDTIENHAPRTNSLGLAEATNLDNTASTDFYGLAFSALGLYFGWDPITTPGVSAHLSAAPWECSWLDVPPFNPEPCVGGLDPYGAPWLLLRYLSDRFNGTVGGGEAGIQHALIDNALTGYALVASVIGVPMDSLLTQFAAMMYVDDAVSGAGPELSEASWNLYDVFYGSYTTGGQTYSLRKELRLTPVPATFGTFSQAANVRAASSYYALLSGSLRPAFALRARNGTGGVLPGSMRYWVVRIQ